MVPDSPQTREWWEFVHSVYDLDEDQVIFTTGQSLHMNDDILRDADILSRIRAVSGSINSSTVFVPFANTPTFRAWALQFGMHKVGYFGERPKFAKSLLFGCGMFLPQWQQRDDDATGPAPTPTPTLVSAAGVRCIEGYVCSSPAQLSQACAALEAQQIVVRHTYPLSFKHNTLVLNDPSELALYPPRTDSQVAVHKVHPLIAATQGDYHSHMVVVEEEEIAAVLLVRHSKHREVEWSPVVRPADTDAAGVALFDALTTTATTVLRALEVRTCGVLEFIVEPTAGTPIIATLTPAPAPAPATATDGAAAAILPTPDVPPTPVAAPIITLVDARMGCFAPLNAFMKMVRTSVPANRTWRLISPRAPTRVTAWMLWNRLKQKKAVFSPGESKKGVLPVLFLAGVSAVVLVVGRDLNEVQKLVATAEACLTEPTAEIVTSFSMFKRQAFWRKKAAARIWAHSPLPTSVRVQRVVGGCCVCG